MEAKLQKARETLIKKDFNIISSNFLREFGIPKPTGPTTPFEN